MASSSKRRCFCVALTIGLIGFVTIASWSEHYYFHRRNPSKYGRVPLLENDGYIVNYMRKIQDSSRARERQAHVAAAAEIRRMKKATKLEKAAAKREKEAAAADKREEQEADARAAFEELQRLREVYEIQDEHIRNGSSVAMEIGVPMSELNLQPAVFDGKHFGNIHRLTASGTLDPRAYVRMSDFTKVFFYSVIAMNSSETTSWDVYKINGWEPHTYISKQYKCCFMYMNKIVENPVQHRHTYLRKKWNLCFEARQYVCKDPLRDNVNNKRPLGVTLTERYSACPESPSFYLKPYYPEVPPIHSFTVYVKPIYGAIDAGSVIEWLEFVKFFGVHKVYMYPERTINSEALSVLLYYANTGFVDLSPIGSLPLKEKKDHCQRTWTQRHNHLVGQEEQVFTFDAQARIHGYQYGAILDTDEYAVPNIANVSYVEFMDYMLALPEYRKASSFRMQSVYHILDWDKTGSPDDNLMMVQYLNRTQPIINAPKNFFVTERVQPGSINFHASTPKQGYKQFTPSTDYIALHHFRHCKRKWTYKNKNKCFNEFKRIRDNTMVSIAEQIAPRISQVRQHLSLPDS